MTTNYVCQYGRVWKLSGNVTHLYVSEKDNSALFDWIDNVDTKALVFYAFCF